VVPATVKKLAHIDWGGGGVVDLGDEVGRAQHVKIYVGDDVLLHLERIGRVRTQDTWEGQS